MVGWEQFFRGGVVHRSFVGGAIVGDAQQLPLFDDQEESLSEGEPEEGAILHPGSPLWKAIEVYEEQLSLGGYSPNTIKSFRSDLNLLGVYARPETPIGEFSTRSLNDFLHWLLARREAPCSPKSYARRVTTLKSFFKFLYENNAIGHDPAEAVIQQSVSSPLPVILYPGEVQQVLRMAQGSRADPDKPDARPLLLVTLLLQTGIKKGECMGVHLAHIDRSDPAEPVLSIRYENPRRRHKERHLRLAPEWLDVLDDYMAQYRPQEKLFNCTARYLEYILADLSTAAGLEKKISFEMLRWTCAVTDYANDMDPERLRQKLGLSRISWRETFEKIQRLAGEAL
jgi:site-specific recombinase XerD